MDPKTPELDPTVVGSFGPARVAGELEGHATIGVASDRRGSPFVAYGATSGP